VGRKITAVAPANIAFIKYWGARDLDHALPCQPSISMTLERCVTRTTVEALGEGADDELRLPDAAFAPRIERQLAEIRRHAGSRDGLRIATENSFPSAAGMASSASGFAALTLAATRALGLVVEPRELSRLARRSGSGSAARSALGGYVEWPAGASDAEGYAFPLAPAEHWALCDVIAIVDSGSKPVSSLEGHRRASSSPYFETRLRAVEQRLALTRQAIAERRFDLLGPVVEEEAIDLHLIAMSSRPPIFYWRPGTLAVLEQVRQLRQSGVAAWATLDAGPNVHVICMPPDEQAVAERLGQHPAVTAIVRDRVGAGPRLVDEHLF
jgi:diphosphomevalonate decarboxylase